MFQNGQKNYGRTDNFQMEPSKYEEYNNGTIIPILSKKIIYLQLQN